MGRAVCIALIGGVCALLLLACRRESGELRIFDTPAPAEHRSPPVETLQVRGDWSYPPFEYLDSDGEPAGFNIDIIRRVTDIMDIPIEIELGPWTEVRRQLEAGEIDILAGMYRSPERDAQVDFTIPHFIASFSIFVTQDSQIGGAEELRDARIIVQEADLAHDYLLEEGIGRELITVREWEQVLPALAAGRGDAAVMGMVQGVLAMEEGDYDPIRMVGGPLVQRSYSIAVAEGRAELLSMLNEGLNILKSSGEYDEIYERWFGVIETYSGRSERRLRSVLIAAALLAGALLLGLLWSLALRREVKRKTAALSEELVRRQEVQRRLESALSQVEASRREAEAARAAAEEADEAKSRFLGGVSHELRTPLHGIMGVERLLSRSRLDEEQRRLLGDLRSMSEHLLRIISDLIDLTRVRAGKLSLHPAPFRLEELAEWAEPVLRGQAEKKRQRLEFRIDGGGERLYGDKERIVQIIVNLGSNAVKFSPEGGELRLTASRRAAGLTIRAEDSGPGVPEGEREQIFRPFFQHQGPGGPTRKGLGLGLSIVGTLTELMGGRVAVDARPGGGSVFTVELPLERAGDTTGEMTGEAKATALEDGAPAERPPLPVGPDSPWSPLSEQHESEGEGGGSPAEAPAGEPFILVVEDEAINRFYLVRILAERGWSVESAASGEEAVELAGREGCAMVLMDLSLPGIDGAEAARRIRNRAGDAGREVVPIIALTAHAGEEDRRRCRAAGMKGFLSKPFREGQLWAEIERVAPMFSVRTSD
jgi:signal transduction histidine kinase/ActR/RegA family two-component response regulator